ncbi:tubby-like F-box protein 11 [Impatiens glandulifera]|uniref:tubby-like F-box protein 11 n=1 Tax=Impatiens glandulifera TaxID=253017 RepID=UPI001FB11E62|nr:tubby-like F-box protein 11 [Impatiens glandulifera]
MKFGRAYRSRSLKVVQDCSVSLAPPPPDKEKDVIRQSCWSNMPQELLIEVLARIEASENSWPLRKNVVACAGVCRSWREVMKEIVRTPEISGKLTFPISVKQPGPRDSLFQCFIRRNPSTQTFRLYLNLTQALADDGKFLLASRKFRHATCTDYFISLNTNDMSRDSRAYVGKLRANFLGTKFTIYDSVPPHAGAKMSKSCSAKLVGSKQVSPRAPAGNYPVAHISYELNMLGSRGPRRMNCVVDAIPASAIGPEGMAPTQTEFPHSKNNDSLTQPSSLSKSISMENSSSSSGHYLNLLDRDNNKPLVLRNKSPRWHEQLQCWCLNFHGRVTVASVKNFQLVASADQNGPEQENVILQFGKVGKDVFTMDYRYPISAFQAFAISLSSFDTKIACE